MKAEYTFRELGVNELALSLIEGAEIANEFFPTIRPLADCVARKIAELERCAQASPEHRSSIAAILRRQQPRPEEPNIIKALNGLEEGAFLLVSGQQAGVCLGPMYTLIKAAALIALRDKLSRELPEHRFVALFWAGGMDHDFSEIRCCYVYDRERRLRSVCMKQPDGTTGQPVGRIELTPEGAARLPQLIDIMPATDHTPGLRKAVAECYAPGKTYSLAFRELLAGQLAEHGLLIFESEDEEAKALGKALFASSVERQDEEAALLGQRNSRIGELGFELQVSALEDETNLFLIAGNGMRDKLVRVEGGFATKAGQERFTAEELRKRVELNPASLSFGVMLRPVFQQALFPVAVYLGGTSEAAYWAQMYPLFRLHGLPEPLLVPRPGFTLVSRRTARLLDRYKLELTDFLQPQHELLRQLSARAIPPTLSHRIRELQSVFTRYATEMRDDAVKLDEGLGGVLDTLSANFHKHLATVEKKIAQAAKRKDDLLVQHVSELFEALMPQGKLQERTLTALSAINEYGSTVIDAIRDACEFPPPGHRVITP